MYQYTLESLPDFTLEPQPDFTLESLPDFTLEGNYIPSFTLDELITLNANVEQFAVDIEELEKLTANF